jgi:hypothetical protein
MPQTAHLLGVAISTGALMAVADTGNSQVCQIGPNCSMRRVSVAW